MGLGLGLGIWWPIQTSIIPGLLKLLEARADYFENKTCTTNTLDAIAAVRYTAPVLPTGLLADYPGAAAAYSLRNLIDTTTSVVRVRRSNDNTEQDFTSTEITDGTLTTFTGANDGSVTTWYDQSGNGNNATQPTASQQPKLVSSGVVELDNGKPCLNYDSGGNDSFTLNSSLTDVGSVFQVCNFEENSGGFTQPILGHSTDYDYSSGSGDELLSSQYASSSVRNGNNYINSVSKDFTTIDRPLTQVFISMIHASANAKVNRLTSDRNLSNRSLRGKMQELILYPSDQSTNRIGIETNINAEYLIYDGVPGDLLIDYMGASAAYSLRNLLSSTNFVVRVRRSNDNTEQDFTAEEVVNGTLTTFTGANDGFVTTWYDQSGNNNNAAQASANNQPKIVTSGVVLLSNNKPSLRFKEGSANRHFNQPLQDELDSSFSVLSVVQGETASTQYEGLLATNTMMKLARVDGEDKWGTFPNGTTNTNLYTGTINLVTMISSDGNAGDFYTNNNSDGSFTNTGPQTATIGGISGQQFNGYISEMVIYPSDQSTNRAGIETNINEEYSIY